MEYRKFVSHDDYMNPYRESGKVVPPTIIFQPWVVRDGVEGYMLPCRPDDLGAEEWDDTAINERARRALAGLNANAAEGVITEEQRVDGVVDAFFNELSNDDDPSLDEY